MGGDCWTQTGPYQEQLADAFHQLQQETLDGGEGEGFEGRTMAELWADEEWQEYIGTGGTGTVVDLIRLVAPEAEDDFGTLRPLSAEEIRAWSPDGRPTYAQWIDAQADDRFPWPDSRGSARCTVLHQDGLPHEIAYWGITAD